MILDIVILTAATKFNLSKYKTNRQSTAVFKGHGARGRRMFDILQRRYDQGILLARNREPSIAD